MTKSQVSLTVDSEMWDLLKQKYPGKISELTQDYYKSLLLEETKHDDNQLDKLEAEAIKNISKQRAKLNQIQSQKKRLELKKKKEEEERLKKNDELLDVLNAYPDDKDILRS